jgi:hypothetical protein
MAHVKKDRVAGTTNTAGTGPFTLSSGATQGYTRFQDALSNGDTCFAMIADPSTGDYQGSLCSYNAGVLTVVTILSSSASGAAVTFAANAKDVFIYNPAAKNIVEDNNGDVSVTRTASAGTSFKAGSFLPATGGTGDTCFIGFNDGNGPGIEFWGSGTANAGNAVIKYAGSEKARVTSEGLIVLGDLIGVGVSQPSAFGRIVSSQSTATAGAAFAALTPGAVNGESGGMALYATFPTGADIAPRRVADIYGAFLATGWNNEALIFAVGNGGAPNDTKNVTSEKFRILGSTGDFLPAGDNVQNVGSASKRLSTLYAGTGTINTSDESDKTNIRTLTDAETAVAVSLASKVQVWQWKDSIAAKGVDAARLHCGLTAQTVRDTFIASGLEPFRYGCVGFDALTKTESYTETVQRPKMQTVDVQEQSVEIVNGVPTLVTKTVQRSQPVGAMVPVVDGNGQAVTVQTGTDADGRPVMGPMLHFVPEMESVDETRTRTVPDLDTNGEPVLRMNVRPDQLAMWIAHGVAHRLAALEAKAG